MRSHRFLVPAVVGWSLACAGGASDAVTPAVEAPEPAGPGPSTGLPPQLPPLEPTEGGGDDCMLQVSDLETVLEPEQAGGAKVTVDRRGHLAESFTLPDGTPVRVFQGGCVHYHYSESFGLAKPPDDPVVAVLALSNQLQRIPNDDPTVKGMLEDAGKLDANGDFPCGDATCSVRVLTDGPNPVLVLDYDFPI